MKKERIIVDMDEVIADPLEGMIQWYRKHYDGVINIDAMRAGSIVKGFPEEHQALVRQQLFEPGFFRHLPVMPDSQRVLKEINEKYELFIVSAAMEFPNSLKDKYDWLGDHFPFISWRQIVLCGDKKLVHGDHMIDDHVRNLVDFPGEKYLYAATHNVDETRYRKIYNWQEAGEVFLGGR